AGANANADNPAVETRNVTVAGVRIVLQKSDDKSSLYKKLHKRTDLRQLTLCADEVVIGCELELPGTDVPIYARTLRFHDAGGEIARINTTPVAIPAELRAKQEEALRGQKAGDVHLYVSSLDAPGTAHRIIANGGQGQGARYGLKGDRGQGRNE